MIIVGFTNQTPEIFRCTGDLRQAREHPTLFNGAKVDRITLSEQDLQSARVRLTNVPMIDGKTELVWHGDLASFIFWNL